MSERIKFVGIDRFNRPVFKSLDRQRQFYGSVNKLFFYEATEEKVLEEVKEDDLCYFGSSFDCEPYGGFVEGLKIVKES